MLLVADLNKMQTRTDTGFTLVELVTTIMLIAILSVAVLPRFLGSSSYSAFTLRDEFIAELRRIQLMAINNQDRCYGVDVSPSHYRMMVFQTNCTDVLITGTSQSLPSNTSLSLSGNTTFALRFNQDGIIAPQCVNACVVKVSADETLDLTIESQGYIHGR